MNVAECEKTIQRKLTEFYEWRNATNDKNLLLQFLSYLPAWTDFCLTNAILIFSQKPKARNLKVYEDWNEKGFNIIAGEESVSLLFYCYKGREVEPYVKSFFGDDQICKEGSYKSAVRHDIQNQNTSLADLYDFLQTTFAIKVQYAKLPNDESFLLDYKRRIVTIPVLISDQECFIRLIQAASELEIQDTLQKRKIEKAQFEFCQFIFSFYLANLFQSKFRFFENKICAISEKLNLEGFTRCLFRTYCSLQSVTFAWKEFQKNLVFAFLEKPQKPQIPISPKQNLADRIQAAKRRTGG